MRTRSAGARIVGLLGAVILLGVGCFPIPEIKEKIVELVVTSSVSAEFEAQGLINLHEDEVTVALDETLDLEDLLADAGIDVSEVESISFGGAAYEVIEPDPVANRRITGGVVTVQRQGGVQTDLITNFSAPVVVTGYEENVTMESGGVAVIDEVLQDMLQAVKNHTTPPNAMLTFTVSGTSEPITEPSNFRWGLRLYVSVVGQIEMDLVDF